MSLDYIDPTVDPTMDTR